MSSPGEAYVVRRRLPWRVGLRGVVGVGVIVLVISPAGGLLWARLPVSRPLAWMFLAMTVFFVQAVLRQQTRALRIDRHGVELAGTRPGPGGLQSERVRVPWPSIAAVVVAAGSPGWIGTRLRPGAPLPHRLRAIVEDPADPCAVAPGLRQPIAGWTLDHHRLAQAVRTFAPHVEVVNLP